MQDAKQKRGAGRGMATAIAPLLVALATALALATPATAAVRHLPLGPFGSAEQPSLTAPIGLAVDPVSGELYAIDAGRKEVQRVTVAASAGKFKLKYEAASTVELEHDATNAEVQTALRNAVCGGEGCLTVFGGPGGTAPYTVTFTGALGSSDVPQLECEDGTPPLSGGAGCSVETTTNGANGGVDRYHADGTASAFASLAGSNTIDGRGPGADETPQGRMAWALSGTTSQISLAPEGAAGGTAGDIYVTQLFDKVVDVFGPDGDYLGRLSEYKQGPSGEGALKGFGSPCGVGVDGTGDVYVDDPPNGTHKYHPSGNPVANTDTTANFTSLATPCVVVPGSGSTAGYLFVNQANGELFKVDANTGEVKYKVNTLKNTTITVDKATGHVYTATGNEVREYDAAGESEAKLVSTTTVPNAPATVMGIAVNEGKIYLSRSGKTQIEAFGPLVALPDVITLGADGIGATSATLHGTISAAGGPDATCSFEYTTKEAFEADSAIEGHDGFAAATALPCAPSGPFGGEAINEVSAEVTGLQAATAYEYRLAGENENGPIAAPPRETETPGKVLFKGGTAGEVTATGALIFGEANPHGFDSSVAVQYVSQARFAESGYAEAITAPARALPATVSGSGDLSTATGSGDLSAAKGGGKLSEGSSQITGLSTSLGEFAVGQAIESQGAGIAAGTTILAVAATTLTISAPATASTETGLKAGSKTVANLATATGAFAPGEEIEGAGIAAGTSVIAVGAGTLTLSKPATAPGLAVALKAASKTITGVVTLAGAFGPDQAIEGAGIAPGTKIVAVGEGALTLSAAVSEGGVGVALSASGYQPVSEAIAGLQPETAYRFRLIGENEAGDSAEEPDHAFSTFGKPGAGLPDGRAYELVSPAQKLGEVFPPNQSRGTCSYCIPGYDKQKMPMQARPDGGAMAYEGGPFAGGLAAGANEYLAERSPSGWATSALSEPAFRDDEHQGFKALSEDLATGVLYQIEPSLGAGAPTDYANLYRWSEGGALQPLNLTVPPARDPGSTTANKLVVTYAGANAGTASSPAFTHIAFTANDALTGEAAGVAPPAPAVAAGETNVYEWSAGQLRLVNVAPGNATAIANATVGSGLEDIGGGSSNFNFEHAVSADGSRIFWSAVPSGQLYVREDGTSTIKVPDPGRFLNAATDGSKVLLSDGKVYDLQAEALSDLSGGQGGFEGSLGASADLSRIYFVDTKVLGGEEENENGEAAEAGALNLYLAQEGSTTFIGRLLAQDKSSWYEAAGNRTAQVSADGRYAAFNSAAALTGYDNRHAGGGGCAPSASGGGLPQCGEAFAYDAVSGKLRCASCNPTGGRPLGYSSLSLLFGNGEAFPQPHNLPSQGEGRLFFESQDTLSADDLNGRIQDVYEWQPEGVGGCGRAPGCVGLISSGRSPKDSQFVNATPSGRDAFFTTRAALVPQDVDDFMDLYDARVGGGIPYNPPVPCEGEACRGPTAAAPTPQSPGSLAFAGPGNPRPRPARCKKRFVRRHGRCVKRHAHRHKHKRRHKHRRAHAKRRAAR
jgi:hypothetical protein